MAAAPELMNLLSLDPTLSQSPFRDNHRFILIEKDFSNSGDFVFSNLIQHFGKREPNTQIILITLNHNWTNYSVSAAKCGFNLRKRQDTVGNIDVISIMDKYLEDVSNGKGQNDFCDYILQNLTSFFERQDGASTSDQINNFAKSPPSKVVMIDDLSILFTLGCSSHDVYRMVLKVLRLLGSDAKQLPQNRLNHLIVQTMFVNVNPDQHDFVEDNQLNFLLTNLRNISDLQITLRPLETGYSTRVDGTIKVVDNRLPSKKGCFTGENRPSLISNMLSGAPADIGSTKAYFYKLSDRRVRLTSSAIIF